MKSWITFAGIVLIIGVLNWGEAVLAPVALAALMAFVLAPPVNWLERKVGRVASVVTVVTLVFVVLGIAGWGLLRQLDGLADDLPTYRRNIVSKISDIRGAGRGGTVEKLQETIEGIKTEIDTLDKPSPAAPVVLKADPTSGSPFPGWLDSIMAQLGFLGLVIGLVAFMLLERRDLRGRLIGVMGQGSLPITTKAFQEASRRVSRQLLTQSLLNLGYGAAAAAGLYFLDTPYPLVWGAFAAVLRFIPYLGPLLGAGAPILVTLAAQPGWSDALLVIGFFVILEVLTNLVLEPVLYAGAAGVSQVALLISLAFWTWLWGPLGLLMATPLTVCVVVLGKHVRGLAFVGTLMADTPPLAPRFVYYQRLLARDPAEAAELIDQHISREPPGSVYDELLLPALNYAERDRLEKRLSPEEELAVIDTTRELLNDTSDSAHRHRGAQPPAPVTSSLQALTPSGAWRVLGYAVNGAADEVALAMLAQSLENLPLVMEIRSGPLLASELVELVRSESIAVLCLADLPPSPPTKTRYLVKRLHAELPELRIIVGRWGPEEFADENAAALSEAGATLLATTILETTTYLRELCDCPREPLPDQPEMPVQRAP